MDIEGTTTSIAFVHETLTAYARARMAAFLADNAGDDAVAHELAEIRRMEPDVPELATLLALMDRNSTLTPLKTLQGMIWRAGYAAGDLHGGIYPDAASALRRWSTMGLRLYVYSSGSVEAQKLMFKHSAAGDLVPLFSAFFDTGVGSKREPESYGRLALGMHLPPNEMLFLSAVEKELDAAATAGFRTCQLVRESDGTIASDRHDTARNFAEIRAIST